MIEWIASVHAMYGFWNINGKRQTDKLREKISRSLQNEASSTKRTDVRQKTFALFRSL